MLSKSEAKEILSFRYAGMRVETGIDFDGLWVFRAFMPIGGGEENMSPFFSVDKTTGEDNDFSVMACSDPLEFGRLMMLEDQTSVLDKPATPQEALRRSRD